MVSKQVVLTEAEASALEKLATERGKSEEQVIKEAILCLIPTTVDREKRDRAIEACFGIWRERMDVPDIAALRREWDQRVR